MKAIKVKGVDSRLAIVGDYTVSLVDLWLKGYRWLVSSHYMKDMCDANFACVLETMGILVHHARELGFKGPESLIEFYHQQYGINLKFATIYEVRGSERLSRIMLLFEKEEDLVVLKLMGPLPAQQ